MIVRHVPLFNHHASRSATGLVLAAVSPFVGAAILGGPRPGLGLVVAFVLAAWLPAVLLTDKYRHKYPQRYDTYLAASHLKAAVVMAVLVLAISIVAGSAGAPRGALWVGLAVFVAADALVSVPRRRAGAAVAAPAGGRPAPAAAVAAEAGGEPLASIDAPAILAQLAAGADDPLSAFVRAHLPDTRGNAGTVDVVDDPVEPVRTDAVGLIVGRTRLNDVNRLNRFLEHCAGRVVPGGYLAVTYTPLETVIGDLRRRHHGLRYWLAFLPHFVWYRAIPKLPWLDRLYFSPLFRWLDRLVLRVSQRRNRALPKAEAWGRLAFWGFEVVAESAGDGDTCILARRVSAPVANRRPSYYAVVALEKVGLDGALIRTHKVRSMYPFSEFLQRRIYESHGLTATGKFKDDFRLTEYGKLIRRHWIDELPGLFDWLHGEIKLVGMRATSPQFLSTYPQELYDLYIQVKPGLIPPIFDESTDGFAQIVAIELAYLRRYHDAPIRTDIAYFWYTFRDIVFRRVRSH